MIFPEQELNMVHCKQSEYNFKTGPTSALSHWDCILESSPATRQNNELSIAAGMLYESFKKINTSAGGDHMVGCPSHLVSSHSGLSPVKEPRDSDTNL